MKSILKVLLKRYIFLLLFQDGSDVAIDKMRRLIDDVLLSQQTALEIFTNVCCDETSGEWEDAESVSLIVSN